MSHIHAFHGLRVVFGIITDFETWRVGWLSSSDKAASATSLDSAHYQEPMSPQALTQMRGNHTGEYGVTDRDLPSLIVSVLLSSKHTEPVLLWAEQRICIQYRVNCWGWRTALENPLSLQCPGIFTQHYNLLYDKKVGRDGEVWLACNDIGAETEYRLADVARAARREVSYFHRCGVCAFYTVVWNQPAVIMSFGFQCADGEECGPYVYQPLERLCHQRR